MTDPIAGVVATTKGAVETLDRLGVLEAVKAKLVGDPDRAGRHLALVLAAIDTTYRTLDREVLGLSTLEFSPKSELNKSRNYLRRLKNDGLKKQIAEANANCKLIKVTYKRWLRGWFRRVLNQKEASDLKILFDNMSILDESLIGVMWGLSDRLKQLGESVLSELDNQGAVAAEKIVRAAEKELDSQLAEINQKLAKLGELKGEFLAAGRVLPT